MQRRLAIPAAVAVLGFVAGCGGGDESPAAPTPKTSQKLVVTSSAFTGGATIPSRFTCDGENVSPPLKISDVPTGSAELVLLVQDPDAPKGTFTHWIMWGITPDKAELTEGEVPQGATQGHNSFGHDNYGGPCPPHGQKHRYVFSVFAADKKVDLPEGASAQKVLRALDGHALASGTLLGHYGR